MNKKTDGVELPIHQAILQYNEILRNCKVSNYPLGENLLAYPNYPPKVLAALKINILSEFLANRCRNYLDEGNPVIIEIINNFKKQYPDRKDHEAGLNKICEEYYSLM